MYSVAWVIQFEIKGTCIEFMINKVSPQGNEICRGCSPNFFVKYMTAAQDFA